MPSVIESIHSETLDQDLSLNTKNSVKNLGELQISESVTKLDGDMENSTCGTPETPKITRINSEQLFSKLSPYFKVGVTSYGGRGCYASCLIRKGTKILDARKPVGSSIARPFRKEVCTWCFHYMDGKTLKHKVQQKIYFCLDSCQEHFCAYDPHGVLANTLIAVEDAYVKCQSELDADDISYSDEKLQHLIDLKWSEVAKWESTVNKTKPTKRAKLFPKVTNDDYTEIKYVILTIYSMYRNRENEKLKDCSGIPGFLEKQYLCDMNDVEALQYEEQILNLLDSSELDKYRRYPYLVDSYVNIYKFIRLVAPSELLPFVTTQIVRDIIGKNLTNAFGIWSPTTSETEDREFFGFGVYPSGSFFNHSCDSNVTKKRTEASYEYVTTRDIEAGEELCISYGILPTDSVAERRKALREWFFECGCKKCVEESLEK